MSQTATTATRPQEHTSPAPDEFELRTLDSSNVIAHSAAGRKGDSATFREQIVNFFPQSQIEGDGVSPADAQGVVERWNHPHGNIGKMSFAFLSFMVAGMNDGAIGVCIARRKLLSSEMTLK